MALNMCLVRDAKQGLTLPLITVRREHLVECCWSAWRAESTGRAAAKPSCTPGTGMAGCLDHSPPTPSPLRRFTQPGTCRRARSCWSRVSGKRPVMPLRKRRQLARQLTLLQRS